MKRPTVMLGLAILAALGLVLATQLIVDAPREATMGVVQKIFYFHVPCAWLCFLSAFLCAIASVRVLTSRDPRALASLDATAELTVLFVRKYGGAGGTRLAAGLAIFGAADVPLIYASVSLWRTIHPKTTVVKSLEPAMRPAFWTSLLTFTIAYLVLLAMRTALAHAERKLDDLHRAAEDLEDHTA